MKMYRLDDSFNFRPVDIKGVRKPRGWPGRPGCWYRTTKEGPVLFLGLVGEGPWHQPRLPSSTKVERVKTIGQPNFDVWASALPFASLAGAIWEAEARCQQQNSSEL